MFRPRQCRALPPPLRRRAGEGGRAVLTALGRCEDFDRSARPPTLTLPHNGGGNLRPPLEPASSSATRSVEPGLGSPMAASPVDWSSMAETKSGHAPAVPAKSVLFALNLVRLGKQKVSAFARSLSIAFPRYGCNVLSRAAGIRVATDTLRSAQVRRISWVRGVGRLGSGKEWPPHSRFQPATICGRRFGREALLSSGAAD
jgi:hypothetical protein